MKAKKLISILLACIMSVGLVTGCGLMELFRTRDSATPHESESSQSPSPTPRTQPGEILFTGKASNSTYEDADYFEAYYIDSDKGTYVADISIGSITVSFVLTKDRDEIYDILIEATNMTYVLGRPGSEKSVETGGLTKSLPGTFSIEPGENTFVLQEMQIGGECFLVLEFDNDKAVGRFRFLHEETWDSDRFAVDFGTRDITLEP